MATYEEQLRTLLAEFGLSDKEESLARFFARTVLIQEGEEAPTGELGITRMGGGPDLSEDTTWPREEGGFHYNFLAQINFADLPFRDLRVPRDGLLSIFCDADQATGPILYTPANAPLRHHPVSETIEQDTATAHEMTAWSPELKRHVLANATDESGIVAHTEPDGRIAFRRGEDPIVALADEYCVTPRSYTAAMTIGVTVDHDRSEELTEAGLDYYGPLFEEYCKRFDAPETAHRMLGFAFTQGGPEWTPKGRAVKRARALGWSDLTNPDDWFVLCELVSGGEVGFSFWDHGSYVVVANVHDAPQGNFSRCFGFVVSS